MEVTSASAPAKIILFGEHFVVFGEPAIVMAINQRAHAQAALCKDKRITVTTPDLNLAGFFEKNTFKATKGNPKEAKKELMPVKLAVQRVLDKAKSNEGVAVPITSDIPVAAGLGSSAAVAASTVKAVSHLLNVRLSSAEIFNITCEAECLVHDTSSGIDPAVATYGGVLLFKRGETFRRLSVKDEIPPLIVANTRVTRCTGDLVTKVRENRENFPSIIDPIIQAGGEIATQAAEALKQDNLQRLGELMNFNHALLNAVGVSCEPIEQLVCAARKAGAVGAKLTGAGGRGCIIALADRSKTSEVRNAIRRAGGTVFFGKSLTKESELKTKPIVLKLGGSAITHKAEPMMANEPVIENLAREIAEAKISQLVIVHGGGSFGHPLAKQYAINEGFKDPSQIIGFAKTHSAMTVLNGLVVKALIRHNIPAVSVAPSSFVVTKSDRIQKMDLSIITKLLKTGFVPVLYGDAVLDTDKVFTILSGDQLVAKLAMALGAEQMVIGVDVDGLFTSDPKHDKSARLFPHTSVDQLKRFHNWTEKAKVTDVTGGMYGKIIELIPAIEGGVRAVIVNATEEGTVRKALRNEPVVGTVIEKE